ncbi:MAG: hypothetical protein Q9195_005945 [Heterodermia aff. obscurata]
MSLRHSVARDAKAIISGGTPVKSSLQLGALIILYPVRNNRNRGDPFSMRQTGVCHKSSGRQSSAWIVLQPSPEVEKDMELAMSDIGYNSTVDEDPMVLHVIFLSFQRANWDDYLEYLRADLEALNEAAHYSRVGLDRHSKYPDSDFSVTFQDCQKLQRFQWKLVQASPALEGNLCVLRTCEERWQMLPGCLRVQATLLEIRGITMQLEFHKEVMRKLSEQARQAANLLHKILDFRANQQMQQASSTASATLSALGSEARTLTLLSHERDKDSKAMRALTFIATLYLPASLIATVFQSNLIQLLPTSSPPQPSRFVVAPQSWLPVVATILLAVLTLISAQSLDRLYRHLEARRLVGKGTGVNTT